jgi:hypothetical protein
MIALGTPAAVTLDDVSKFQTGIPEKGNVETVLKFVTHSKQALRIARSFGWHSGARYTNLRDVRGLETLGFLDIDWKNYSFERHLAAAKIRRPFLTIARDVEFIEDLQQILDEAAQIAEFSSHVAIVPKDIKLADRLQSDIPENFVLGYSVPTKYGGTVIPPHCFTRPTHLLGGRPDVQRRLAEAMPVVSFDCNRFTLDARFGDYFDGQIFRPHPTGGYLTCLEDSVANITALWTSYRAESGAGLWLKKSTLKNS